MRASFCLRWLLGFWCKYLQNFNKNIFWRFIVEKIGKFYKKTWFFKNLYIMRVFIGISPSGKASDSESDIRRFESYYPSHFCIKFLTFCGDLFFIKIFAKKVEKQKFFRIIPLSNYYFFMSEARITRPRRLFIEALQKTQKSTFSELKTELVGKWSEKIDLTTLYRVVETFVRQGIVHEIEQNGEKIIFFASENFDPKKLSSEIIVCEKCGHIETKYENLPETITSRHIVSRKSECENC